ncbi:putative RNA methyltransferase [Acorus gramineus]|uniref:RNA methyltransferase n=1 Tax=Acorus gramineus TaxID=55184 RepID=A0AAV9BLK5_ACOGR|nr:putative RNA methyltransferase [Acorus gramineus]
MDVSCSHFSSNTSLGNSKNWKYVGQSVRAAPMRVLTIGKRRSKGVQILVDEYKEKIGHYCRFEDVLIKSNPKNASSDATAQVEAEDVVVMQHVRSDDWVVVLDERGADIGSEQLAGLLVEAGKTGSSSIAFCIGGPYGHGPRLRKRADVIIRLSSMVLNHQIALVVLLEQLYRAWTIIRGQKYHH